MPDESAVTIVLDDDPTGSQTADDAAIALVPNDATLDWAIGANDLVYVLTNARARSVSSARGAVRAAMDSAARIARRRGRRLRWVSRGDSTLRGHFPLEVAIARDWVPDARGCMLVPAFPSAGRLTPGGIHVVRAGGIDTPVAETEFARDATFGYRESRLANWARSRVPAEWHVTELTSDVIDDGSEAVAAVLSSTIAFTVVCPWVRDGADLEVLAAGQRLAEKRGAEFLVHAGPSYPQMLAGRSARARDDVRGFHVEGPGLIVVGSHTAVTRIQLAVASDEIGLPIVELSAHEVLGAGRRKALDGVAAEAAAVIRSGSSVAIATSSQLVPGGDAESSLRVASRVGEALIDVTRRVLLAAPSFVVAKGGITSYDAAVHSLGWDGAVIAGSLADGRVPAWRSRDVADTRPLVVFAGNVGAPDLLARVLRELTPTTAEAVR